ncbi:hypothetical protein C9J12_18885 [Photobacterium frigidiphilum]|uniref:Uncharacterized protein n=1 Tax=Photobacterium frigidiphilum TaxID=264736 RepID=A0A2T3JBX3_9GAMM|nr:hypothetical protein C9J12_18885 [Photobacterium frigidiphilum]
MAIVLEVESGDGDHNLLILLDILPKFDTRVAVLNLLNDIVLEKYPFITKGYDNSINNFKHPVNVAFRSSYPVSRINKLMMPN